MRNLDLPNSVTFKPSEYPTTEDDFNLSFARFIRTLLDQEYTVALSQEDFDDIQLQFDYAAFYDYGQPKLYWLNEEEQDLIEEYRAKRFDLIYQKNHPDEVLPFDDKETFCD